MSRNSAWRGPPQFSGMTLLSGCVGRAGGGEGEVGEEEGGQLQLGGTMQWPGCDIYTC